MVQLGHLNCRYNPLHAGVVRVALQSHWLEDFVNLVKPMERTKIQSVESLLEEPELVICRRRAVIRWPYDGDLVPGKVAVAEHILAVDLLRRPLFLHCHADNVTQGVRTKDRCKFLRLGLDTVPIVAWNHNVCFDAHS